MKKMSKADIEHRITKGAIVHRNKTQPQPSEEPKADTRKLEEELHAVRAKLETMARQPKNVGKKRNFEFTVERDGSGFIQKIHAKEL